MSMLDDIFLPLAEDAVCASHPAAGAVSVIVDGVEVLTNRGEKHGSNS